MTPFATLLEALIFMPSRNGKLALLERYFRDAPDPDRGYALAALAGTLQIKAAKPALIRELAASRVDPVLFALSYDFVGDLAETVSLIWPARPGANRPPELAEVVERLGAAKRGQAAGLIEGWLDALDATGRWALLKLVTGGMRVGVSARLAKQALAQLGNLPPEEVEAVWHGLAPPYAELFAWAEGRAERPVIDAGSVFHPLMLANPLEEGELERLDPGTYAAEWKWDGIRVQLSADGTGRGRIFSRSGDEITHSFPDLADRLTFQGVLDGELLVLRDGQVMPFGDLQQRLNRKTVNRKIIEEFPVHVRLYDMLFDAAEDIRALPFDQRRARLETWFRLIAPQGMDLSPLIGFADWAELSDLRDGARDAGIEGLMLKERASPYLAGRPKGPWFKWKRDALTADCVILYAQRGHGKRSSLYSDFTFGCWRDRADGQGRELVPVGKAYSGFTDAELKELDRFVQTHTTERFGPVRAVEAKLVVEVAFDSVQRSTRHKSGIAMRFPRFHRLRWDKPVEEADTVASLEKLI